MRKAGTFLTMIMVLVLMVSKPAQATSALTGLSIGGASSIEGGKSETYTATASYSDGSSSKVTPSLWYVTPPTHASISTSGVVTTKTVSSQQTLTVYASYTEGGVTQSKTLSVSITPSSTGTNSTSNTSTNANSNNKCASGAYYQSSNGSLCLGMKKVMTPSGHSKLRGKASWSGFASSSASVTGSTFSFAWENYESDANAGTLYENNPAQGALFVLAYAFPNSSCSGGASFFAVIEAANAASINDLGSSINFTPLFGQICGTNITTLNTYTLTRQ